MKSLVCTLIEISLKIVPKCPIDNNQAVVKIMAWRWISDKPLSESMLTWFTDAYRQSSIGWDTIIFYACTMEVWHFSSYFTIKNYVNDDIRPHPTQFSWPSSFVETFDTLKSAIEPRMTRLTHSKRHEKSRLHVNSYETSWMIEVTLTENLELKRMRSCTLIHCTVSLASRTKTTIGQ